MNNELITVIITTYMRHFNMLNRAIQSVLNQTYNNLELIIVDDSPENYEQREVIKKRIEEIEDNRIKYIQHSINKGACAARNTGINNSKGNIIMFLDDDDEWLRDKIELQVKALSEKNADFAYCSYKNIIESNNKSRERIISRFYNDSIFFEKLMGENFIGSVSFVAIKKKCFEKCGLFNEELKSCQDWDMWIRVLSQYKVCYVDKPLVIYHTHQMERITSNPKKQLQGHEFILSKYNKYLKKYPEALRENLYRLSRIYADNNNYKKSFSLWAKGNRIKPFSFNQSAISIMRIVKRGCISLVD